MLTATAVLKYFPESDETQKGQGLQSTTNIDSEQQPQVVFATQSRVREINVYIKDMKHIIYTDQTGQFPVVSSQGNRYIMVLCKTDGNLILVKPIKNRTSGEMCKAYK